MSDYITLSDMAGNGHVGIERITLSHILLVSMHNMVPIIRGKGEKTVKDLDYERKDYILMKKSRQDRWGDIGFYNYHEDLVKVWRGVKGFDLSLPDGGGSLERLVTLDENYCEKLYRRVSTNRIITERSVGLLRRFLTQEYNIFAEAFNLKPVPTEKAVYYLLQSQTAMLPTLYFFFFYTPDKYRSLEDVTTLLKRIESLPMLSRLFARVVNTDRHGLFDCPRRNGTLEGIGRENGVPFLKWNLKGVDIKARVTKNSFAFFNDLQADQLIELASFGSSKHMPTSFFGRCAYPMLNPRFRVHRVIDRLNEGFGLLDYFTGRRKLSDLNIEYRQRKPEDDIAGTRRPIGIMMIDHINCKRFYEQATDFGRAIDALKAFQNDIADILHRHFGYVIQTAGDGVYAIVQLPRGDRAWFPSRHRRDSEKIILYGLMLTIALLVQETGWETRIGIDYSMDTYYEGILGPMELEDYTITGVNVNIAASLEGKIKTIKDAKHGILMPATFDMTQEWIEMKIEGLGLQDSYMVKPRRLKIYEARRQKVPLKKFWHIYKKKELQKTNEADRGKSRLKKDYTNLSK